MNDIQEPAVMGVENKVGNTNYTSMVGHALSLRKRESVVEMNTSIEKVKLLENLLFPNRTIIQPNKRSLSFGTDKYTTNTNPSCGVCSGLTTCKALNGLLIQEVYYPLQNQYKDVTGGLGTCRILDQRGVRISKEIFGPDNTFRDTPTCRSKMLYL